MNSNNNTSGARRTCSVCRLPTWGGNDLCPDCRLVAASDIWRRLAAPFDLSEIKHRPQGKIQLTYVTARTVMNRLDEVLGPPNWWDSYLPMENSVLCTLTLKLLDGTTVSKQDAGGYAGMSDQGDDDKSGYSDSFKRAAVKFGVGRYLYRDGIPKNLTTESTEHTESSGMNLSRSSSVPSVPSVVNPPRRPAPRTGRELDDYVRTCKIDPGLVLWMRERFPKNPHRPADWTDLQVMAGWPAIREHLKACKAARNGAGVQR
jgi:hypothetical protein